ADTTDIFLSAGEFIIVDCNKQAVIFIENTKLQSVINTIYDRQIDTTLHIFGQDFLDMQKRTF
ncbi:MAG: hypothetical protein WCJ37_11180, partial [Syntrophus sp. (in: bacteria)]